ncbi:packaged DNA stabilization gp4 family protein [Pseudomonas aeruginosa]|uniref:packaged DNA stabilization gp4 family protein n=1 Tax=Pseudomonas aeruginosa TaxID=287 RepID=UPI00188E5AAD|nr:packaged DNA stabilization gp4 family protein [Pseudomonas aeruginosa]
MYDEIELPPEYQEAIMYNLALRIYPMYGLPVNDAVVQLAKASMNILEASNVQVPRLKVPGSLTRGGVYNPYADRVR